MIGVPQDVKNSCCELPSALMRHPQQMIPSAPAVATNPTSAHPGYSILLVRTAGLEPAPSGEEQILSLLPARITQPHAPS